MWVWVVIIAAVAIWYVHSQAAGNGQGGTRPGPRSTVCTETYKGGC